MRIAIASGKGGTGKTTVAVNMATVAAAMKDAVRIADCDVEEPNAHLFLRPEWRMLRTETVPVPEVDHSACLGDECRSCVYLCRFKALIWMAGEVMVFPELCHSCGLCAEACPAGAVHDGAREIGQVRRGPAATSADVEVIGGKLRVSEAQSPPLIRAVKKECDGPGIQLWDCPPGTACPAVSAMDGADYVVLVAEPTPFGLNDLTLAVETVRVLGLPFGVVINRHGMGAEDIVEQYLQDESIEVLGRIPHLRAAAQAYSRGGLLVGEDGDAVGQLRLIYQDLWRTVRERTADAAKGHANLNNAGNNAGSRQYA